MRLYHMDKTTYAERYLCKGLVCRVGFCVVRPLRMAQLAAIVKEAPFNDAAILVQAMKPSGVQPRTRGSGGRSVRSKSCRLVRRKSCRLVRQSLSPSRACWACWGCWDRWARWDR